MKKLVSDLQSAWKDHFSKKRMSLLSSHGDKARVKISGATVVDKVDVNPTDLGPLVNMNLPLFSKINVDDINQRVLADCWFLSSLGAIANAPGGPNYIRSIMFYDPLNSQQVIVQFIRNGIITRVHCDLTVATSGNQVDPNDQDIWVEIFEKAYADYRTVTDAFHQLDYGSPYSAMMDLGLINVSVGYAPNVTVSQLQSKLQQGQALALCTPPGAPPSGMIANHCYMIVASDGANITVRNPWGYAYPPLTSAMVQSALISANVSMFAYGSIPAAVVAPVTYTQAELDAAISTQKATDAVALSNAVLAQKNLDAQALTAAVDLAVKNEKQKIASLLSQVNAELK